MSKMGIETGLRGQGQGLVKIKGSRSLARRESLPKFSDKISLVC